MQKTHRTAKIIVHDIIEGTRVNGPGYRFCIWLQGCDKNCDGCFNQEARPIKGGYILAVDEIIHRIENGKYDGVSISGGEPLLQKNIYYLLTEIKKLSMNILVFTGYTYEEILTDDEKRKNLLFIDYLVEGPYIKSIPSSCFLTGSGNQRVLQLNNGVLVGDVTSKFSDSYEKSEIIIDENGNIKITGFSEFEKF